MRMTSHRKAEPARRNGRLPRVPVSREGTQRLSPNALTLPARSSTRLPSSIFHGEPFLHAAKILSPANKPITPPESTKLPSGTPSRGPDPRSERTASAPSPERQILSPANKPITPLESTKLVSVTPFNQPDPRSGRTASAPSPERQILSPANEPITPLESTKLPSGTPSGGADPRPGFTASAPSPERQILSPANKPITPLESTKPLSPPPAVDALPRPGLAAPAPQSRNLSPANDPITPSESTDAPTEPPPLRPGPLACFFRLPHRRAPRCLPCAPVPSAQTSARTRPQPEYPDLNPPPRRNSLRFPAASPDTQGDNPRSHTNRPSRASDLRSHGPCRPARRRTPRSSRNCPIIREKLRGALHLRRTSHSFVSSTPPTPPIVIDCPARGAQ
jgi:hypothetical protein